MNKLMNKDQQEQKKFLVEQLERVKEQDSVLEAIETKLHEMKAVAEYVAAYHLTVEESGILNSKLGELKNDIHLLENRLHNVVH